MHVSSTARRYGRALARVAIERKKEKTVRAELDGLLAFLDDSKLASVTLESRAASVQSKERVVARIADALEKAGKPLTSYTHEFLRVILLALKLADSEGRSIQRTGWKNRGDT